NNGHLKRKQAFRKRTFVCKMSAPLPPVHCRASACIILITSYPKVVSPSITLHQTARAGCAQVRAQFFGTRAALRSNVNPRPAHAAARKPVVNNVWLPV